MPEELLQKLRGIQWTPINVLKAGVLGLVTLVVFSIVLQVLRPVGDSISGFSKSFDAIAPQMAPSGYGMGGGGEMGMAVEPVFYEGSYDGGVTWARDAGTVTLSTANIGMPEPMPGSPMGNSAEEFEVTDYNAFFEVRNKERVCTQVIDLKKFEYVIFERSNEYDHGCNYSFKVEHAHVSDVLALIKELGPKDLSESTCTIKRQIDDFTSQEEILTNKLESMDATLKQAVAAYDDITRLATNTQNADALARIIDSKVGVIERLTQERINLTAQLERLARGKAEQLDKLDYTYFDVSVSENKIVDWEQVGDSWEQAIREFVSNVNQTLQSITVGLIALLLTIVQFVIYIFVLLFVAKYLWRAAKYVWWM